MKGLSYLWTENFFIIWLVIWWFIALIYLVLKPKEKLEIGEQFKKQDLSAHH
jgi:hypothetical protein